LFQSICLSFELRINEDRHRTLSVPVDSYTVLPTFAEACGLPPITERGGRWELAIPRPREYRRAESSEKFDPHQTD